MKVNKYRSSLQIFNIFYFAFLLIYVSCELLFVKSFPAFKLIMLFILMLQYWKTSQLNNNLFFIIFSLLLFSDLFIIYNTQNTILCGSVFFILHELVLAYYIIKVIKLKDFYPLLIAIIPFYLIFFCLFEISDVITNDNFYILVLQYNLVSIIGGIALSNYMISNTTENKKLILFGLLFVTLYSILFMQKYWISTLTSANYNIITLILNAIIYYLFYKWVIEIENESPVTENLNYN